MIARIWRGLTAASRAGEYLTYLEETGLREYRSTPGNRVVYVLRKVSGHRAEFLLISLWDCLEAVQRFAGPDVEKAVYYPKDREFLLELEPKVQHYEVVVGLGPAHRA